MIGALPFETDYVSCMSEDELMDLVSQLEDERFWEQEERIRDFVGRIVEQWEATINVPRGPLPTPLIGYMSEPAQYISSSSISANSTSYRTIKVNLPPWLDERQVRFFAELQVREQMHPGFDPTERET